jgi:hypothetical protein
MLLTKRFLLVIYFEKMKSEVPKYQAAVIF